MKNDCKYLVEMLILLFSYWKILNIKGGFRCDVEIFWEKNVNNVLIDFLVLSEMYVNKGCERLVYFYFFVKCYYLGFDKYLK